MTLSRFVEHPRVNQYVSRTAYDYCNFIDVTETTVLRLKSKISEASDVQRPMERCSAVLLDNNFTNTLFISRVRLAAPSSERLRASLRAGCRELRRPVSW